MDATDLAILQAMSRDKVLWWGRLDPRLSSREIADRVGLAESSVRARIAAWEACGFLRGFETMPNPALFGAGFAGGSVRVDDLRKKPQVIEDIGLVDGMVLTQDHVGPWLAVAAIDDKPTELARRNRLLERLPGVDELEACKPFRVPAATITPTATQWRILRALRAAPTATLHETAERVGVSLRTFTRQYGALVEGGAVWSIPLLDFTKWEGAVAGRYIVSLAPDADPHAVARRTRERCPGLIEMSGAYALIPELQGGALDMIIQTPSVGAVEDVQRALLSEPGVEGVEVVFVRGFHIYPAWFDQRVGEKVLA